MDVIKTLYQSLVSSRFVLNISIKPKRDLFHFSKSNQSFTLVRYSSMMGIKAKLEVLIIKLLQ
jgi:hypothetical protein